MKNLSERYKADLITLLDRGRRIAVALQYDCDSLTAKKSGLKKEELPDVRSSYQQWYSEALACVTQLLPDRVEDFVSYYKPVRQRKDLNWKNYTMSDYLIGATVFSDGKWDIPTSSALLAVYNQAQILEGIQTRFESSLFDIRALVQADLLDDELSAAEELNKHGFTRAAGAVAGVVLETHLAAVTERHSLKTAKLATISTLNDILKKEDVIDVATWRFVQHLGDLRNKCDHKGNDPSKDEIRELIAGVAKITKTVF